MQKRTNITSLKGKDIKGIRRDKDKQNYICFYSSAGRLLFSVDEDQIFDRDGNRFEINLEYN